MSLREAYSLAHTAQCRLQMEANRPDRNLRFVVGHLMHYESLRLRIVEIEHDISKSHRASAVQFRGTGHVDHTLQHKPSTGQLGRTSPPPATSSYSAEDEEDDDDILDDFLDDDEEDASLSLSRFPSGAARPPIAPPDLEPDNADSDDSDEDEDEPGSPEEPSRELIEECIKGKTNDLYAQMYEGLRRCPCHGTPDAPSLDEIWDLPPDQAHAKDGVTRAIAHVRDETPMVQPVAA